MENKSELPQTLQDAILYFSDLDVATQYVAKMRFPNGVVCVHCGTLEPYYLKTRRIWKCKHCGKQFSVKVGTIFEDSPIGLDKWLAAMWMIANAKNGISSYEIHRALGVTQKSAWFMLHRIRLAMQAGSLDKLTGEIEVDETYIGGKAENMHKSKREMKAKGRGAVGKSVVFGILERHGQVRAKHVKNAKKKTLQPEIVKNVELKSHIYSDELQSYQGLNDVYVHDVINHAEKYVDGQIHTNGIENFWSLLKRCFKGTYISCDPQHLFRYLDEETFRFNGRTSDDFGRFNTALAGIAGKRVTYGQLTNNVKVTQPRLFK